MDVFIQSLKDGAKEEMISDLRIFYEDIDSWEVL
jgi:hypothetical protein